MLLTFAAMQSQADDRRVLSEPKEWVDANSPKNPDPKLPNVLLVGDSITRGYYPSVSADLKGKANCYLFASSCSVGDPRLAGKLADFFAKPHPDFAVIHFNNGMHGWGYTEVEYKTYFHELTDSLRQAQPKAQLIWASTTPVLSTSPPDTGKNARIDARNASALEYVTGQHIPLDDLHALMLQHQNLHKGDIHYQPAGYDLLARQAADSILKLLPGA